VAARPHGGRRRRGVLVAAVTLSGWALWPAAPEPGRHEVGAGSALLIEPCGSVVEVHGANGPGDVLEPLWRMGTRRVDLVVAGDGQRNRAVAGVVAEQLGAVLVDASELPAGATHGMLRCR
ncbi:MAG: hypothetical protein M3Y51_02240, partial [Actinomycetota bacterium]|nr:hypothetical protein [Actinomycetota bacterium]